MVAPSQIVFHFGSILQKIMNILSLRWKVIWHIFWNRKPFEMKLPLKTTASWFLISQTINTFSYACLVFAKKWFNKPPFMDIFLFLNQPDLGIFHVHSPDTIKTPLVFAYDIQNPVTVYENWWKILNSEHKWYLFPNCFWCAGWSGNSTTFDAPP